MEPHSPKDMVLGNFRNFFADLISSARDGGLGVARCGKKVYSGAKLLSRRLLKYLDGYGGWLFSCSAVPFHSFFALFAASPYSGIWTSLTCLPTGSHNLSNNMGVMLQSTSK